MTEKEIGELYTRWVFQYESFGFSEINHRYRPCYYIEREV